MTVKSLSILSALGVLLLTSCADIRMGGGAVPPSSPIDRGCHAAAKTCVVIIKADPSKACGFDFDPDPLKVKKLFKEFVIVWRLPAGYEFRTGAEVGDGIKFAKEPTNGEFHDGYPTDDENGASSRSTATGKRQYRWVFANSIREDREYHYLVQFHATAGSYAPIICDPVVSNLGDN